MLVQHQLPLSINPKPTALSPLHILPAPGYFLLSLRRNALSGVGLVLCICSTAVVGPVPGSSPLNLPYLDAVNQLLVPCGCACQTQPLLLDKYAPLTEPYCLGTDTNQVRNSCLA